MSWDFDNMKQLELKLEFKQEEWEKHGFKTREEWIAACNWDREFKYLESRNENHFSYLDPKPSEN